MASPATAGARPGAKRKLTAPTIAEVLILFDAARCPYCARVRIVLAEKGIPYEPVELDLDDRPAWIYTKNPTGRVPVLEEDGGFVLPESRVIMEYLEERYPDPPLLPPDAAERALVRLRFERFSRLSRPYYDALRGRASTEGLWAALQELDADLGGQDYLGGTAYGLADIGYLPWILRAESRLGLDLVPLEVLAAWRGRLAERPAVAAELELVAAGL
jgi:glutathione S-transferase